MTHDFVPLDAADLELDVAIVGAGVSGLYSGWRLLTDGAGAAPSTAIFDSSERVGGRLYSLTDIPGMPNVVGELGGMRYMKHQGIVNGLVGLLKLTPIGFPMGDVSSNLFYLRGGRFAAKQWKDPTFSSRYFINEQDKGKTPDDMFAEIVAYVLKVNGIDPKMADTWDHKDWDAVKATLTYDRGPDKGLHLEDIGFWNLLQDYFGAEGYALLSEAGGYLSNTINWNSAEALPYVIGDFGGNVTYETLAGGYDQLALGLAAEYRKAGGAIHCCSRLVRFDRNAAGAKRRYRLVIRNADDGSERIVHADKIILAMPRRSLELLDQDTFFFDDPAVLHNVRSVLGEPAFKLLLGFYEEGETQPWWTRWLKLTSGESITDLPMRQCYYFGTDPKTFHSLMLASYNDMSTVDFWKPLELPDQGRHRLRHLVTDAARAEEFRPTATPAASMTDLEDAPYPRAPWRMVEHAMAQLRLVHGRDDIPPPYLAAFRNWNDDPFGGGYHAWKARYSVGDVMAYMRKPLAGDDVHVCGEAYSDQQGWVEGALCVAEIMLQRHFGLRWPAPWLPTDYYLGRDPQAIRVAHGAAAVVPASPSMPDS